MTNDNHPLLSWPYAALKVDTVKSLRGQYNFRAYTQRASERSISHGCMTSGDRVVVPVVTRAQDMMLVHTSNRRMVAMKNSTRSYSWRSRIDNQIEETQRSCQGCQSKQGAPPEVPIPVGPKSLNRDTHSLLPSPRQ